MFTRRNIETVICRYNKLLPLLFEIWRSLSIVDGSTTCKTYFAGHAGNCMQKCKLYLVYHASKLKNKLPIAKYVRKYQGIQALKGQMQRKCSLKPPTYYKSLQEFVYSGCKYSYSCLMKSWVVLQSSQNRNKTQLIILHSGIEIVRHQFRI